MTVWLGRFDLLRYQRDVKARQLSQATMRNIRTNLWFAYSYNALGVPVAMLYCFFGNPLSWVVAAAAMRFTSASLRNRSDCARANRKAEWRWHAGDGNLPRLSS